MQPTAVLAAVKLMKVTLDHVLRACNPIESEASLTQRAVSIVVPLIIDKGLTNSTPEVRALVSALST